MATIGKQTWAPSSTRERDRDKEAEEGGREAGGSKLAALVAANMEMLYRYIWYI